MEYLMEKMVSCTLSADGLSEIRRKVYGSRKDTSVLVGTTSTSDMTSHDMRVITAFLAEDFEALVLTLFNERVQPDPWPEINSWDYPGPWLNAITEEISSMLEDRDSGFLFSKSGLYTLKIARIE